MKKIASIIIIMFWDKLTRSEFKLINSNKADPFESYDDYVKSGKLV